MRLVETYCFPLECILPLFFFSRWLFDINHWWLVVWFTCREPFPWSECIHSYTQYTPLAIYFSFFLSSFPSILIYTQRILFCCTQFMLNGFKTENGSLSPKTSVLARFSSENKSILHKLIEYLMHKRMKHTFVSFSVFFPRFFFASEQRMKIPQLTALIRDTSSILQCVK